MTAVENPPRSVLYMGFTCPGCKGVRLAVTHTRKPSPKLVVRYLRCTVCGHREITEERPSKTRRARNGTPPPA